MNRLNQSQIKFLPAEITLPIYDRAKLRAGIVHLGIGAFHRAHQAFYTEAVLNQFGGDWGIIGCSLRSASVRDQLAPQDGLYTLVERSGEGEKLQLIGAVLKNSGARESGRISQCNGATQYKNSFYDGNRKRLLP
jgi:fructuronate reductase